MGAKRTVDAHHLLWEKRMYRTGYAKALRNHAWLKIYIPRDTLHREIHHQMKCIPVPKAGDCKRVFELLARLESKGQLDPNAGIVERLDFLIKHLQTGESVRALKRQRNICLDFYRER